MRRYIVCLLIIGLWQLGAWLGWIDPRLFSSPAKVLAKIQGTLLDGSLPHHLGVSLARSAAGLALGLTAGVALGVANGLWRASEEALDTTIQIVRNVPIVAMTSLFIIWFGFGELTKVLLIAAGCFFPTYVNVFSGIRNADNKLVEMARTMDAKRAAVVWHLLLPAAMPQALVGLRFAMTVSIFALVVAETINATSGIGYLMAQGQQFGQPDLIFMCLIIYALLGAGSDYLVRFLERTLLCWRLEFKGE